MTRRDFFATTAMAGLMGRAAWANEEEIFEVMRSDDEWKAMLSPLEYKVMRKEGTERAFTSPLDKNYADGMYHCRGCDLALYSSCLLYTSPSPRDRTRSRMPSSA